MFVSIFHTIARAIAKCLPAAVFLLPMLNGQAAAGPVDDVKVLAPFWKAHAPLCGGSPSSENCADNDMTLFNGLLCASGEAKGCIGVRDAQDADGRWHRSPRLKLDPSLRADTSFSWDMALGVQLYAVTTSDKASLERWLVWVEANRPCLVESSAIAGKTYCLVRGWPRWCTDDPAEKGCTARPQDLATLVVTIDKLGVAIPPPAEDRLPPGPAGVTLAALIASSRDANSEFSLQTLLAAARGLQPTILLLDAGSNDAGFPRHLVGVEIMLFRALGAGSPTVDRAAEVIANSDGGNPFFMYLAGKPSEQVAARLLALGPHDEATIPAKREDWAWQRKPEDEAWKRSNLWDFVFISRLLAKP
jgi:hypothetical protein